MSREELPKETDKECGCREGRINELSGIGRKARNKGVEREITAEYKGVLKTRLLL